MRTKEIFTRLAVLLPIALWSIFIVLALFEFALIVSFIVK